MMQLHHIRPRLKIGKIGTGQNLPKSTEWAASRRHLRGLQSSGAPPSPARATPGRINMNARKFKAFRRGVLSAAITCVLLSVVIAYTPSPAIHTPNNTEARWKQGELLPPLPANPAARAEAIAQSASYGASRASTPDGGPFYPSVSQTVVTPRSVNMADVLRSGPHAAMSPSRRPPRHVPLVDENRPSRTGDSDVPMKQWESISPGLDGVSRLDAPLGASSVPLPPVFWHFDGLGDTGWYPPDAGIAVGPDHAIQVVNSRFRILNKCGAFVGEAEFASVVNDAESMLFSPDVAYDPWNDRYVMVIAALNTETSNGFTYVMVSQTPDPMAGWWWYTIYGTSGWPDEPQVGIDPSTIYFTTNQYTFSTWFFDHAEINLANSADMYSGIPVSIHVFATLNNPGDGSNAMSLRPAKMHTWPGTYYLVNAKPEGGRLITLWTITGAPAFPVLNSYNMTVGLYEYPPDCIQPDSTLVDMGDCRLGDAVYMLDSLWTCQTLLADWGGPEPRTGIVMNKFIASTRAVIHDSPAGNYGEYFGYPGIDVDADGRVILCFATGSPSQYMSADYSAFHDGDWSDIRAHMKAGEANYDNAGSEPWRWGNHYSVDLDPTDDYTFWLTGEYAPSGPPGTWATHIGVTTFETLSTLSVTPTDTVDVSVLQEVAAWPDQIQYLLENTGSSTKAWSVEIAAGWLSSPVVSGSIPPGETDTVTVTVDYHGLSPGEHFGDLAFADCYANLVELRTVRAVVGTEGACPGTSVWLGPGEPVASSFGVNEERGAYVSAIKDFEVCSVGLLAALGIPQTVTARIYEADGTVRGALVAEGTKFAVVPGDAIHMVPVSCVLESCKDYDIAVEFGGPGYWVSWSESGVSLPYDCGGVIRVRDGELWGNASNTLLPALQIQGTPLGCDSYADLTPEGASWTSVTDPSTERGLFITPRKTINLCAIRWEALFPSVPAEISARVYEATGTARGGMIASGGAVISSALFEMHAIPISAVLKEGHDYDIAIEGIPGGTTWSFMWEYDVTLPFVAGDITVYDGEMEGDASNIVLSHFGLHYSPGVGGGGFDLRPPDKPIPPPNLVSGGSMRQGIYVTSLIEQNLFSLKWVGDVPPATPIFARVYEATGTTRGALISEGAVLSADEGMRWHDISLSAVIEAGVDYDFEIHATNTNAWRWWNDETGLPYEPHGVIRVRDAEQNGNANNVGVVPTLMYACDRVATGISDSKPDRVPEFFLGAPYPNPTSASMELQFGLDSEGPVTIAVYDVSGRRVETLLASELRSPGPGRLKFDSSSIPSGVYFVKMTTNRKSVSRKITIVK